MVRPAALYNKARFTRDFTFLGRVVAVMCGNRHVRREELTDAELSALEELENENSEMEKSLEREAKRKAEYRAAKLAGQNAQAKCPEMSQGQNRTKADIPPCPEMSQGQNRRDGLSAPNSTDSTNSTTSTTEHNSTVCVCVAAEPPPRAPAPARTCEGASREDRRDVPTLKTVVAAATGVMNVSEGYARWWYAEMEARDWTATDGMRISTRNWRPILKSWWNRATPEEREGAERAYRREKASLPRPATEADWLLCQERCALYRGDRRCSGGCVVPPQMRPRPIPPEECQHFKAVETEKNEKK